MPIKLTDRKLHGSASALTVVFLLTSGSSTAQSGCHPNVPSSVCNAQQGKQNRQQSQDYDRAPPPYYGPPPGYYAPEDRAPPGYDFRNDPYGQSAPDLPQPPQPEAEPEYFSPPGAPPKGFIPTLTSQGSHKGTGTYWTGQWPESETGNYQTAQECLNGMAALAIKHKTTVKSTCEDSSEIVVAHMSCQPAQDGTPYCNKLFVAPRPAQPKKKPEPSAPQ